MQSVCVTHIPANFLPEVGFFSLTIKMKLAGKPARNMLRIPGEAAFTGKSGYKMPAIPDEASRRREYDPLYLLNLLRKVTDSAKNTI
jgi:hypothetical protein